MHTAYRAALRLHDILAEGTVGLAPPGERGDGSLPREIARVELSHEFLPDDGRFHRADFDAVLDLRSHEGDAESTVDQRTASVAGTTRADGDRTLELTDDGGSTVTIELDEDFPDWVRGSEDCWSVLDLEYAEGRSIRFIGRLAVENARENMSDRGMGSN